MDKTFEPRAVEARWRDRWEESGYFAPTGRGEPYSIVIPPPNVTGTLHMGHAFQHTLMDALTRYHRMAGFDALWLPGTDHAGIATQMVVERQLEAQGLTRTGLGREEFLKRVWAWKEESGSTITRQIRRMGNSVDWSRERFTMDERLTRAVSEEFVRLHERGLIYRGKRLVNWDPVLQTAISDLEVEAVAEKGHLWHLRYPLEDGSGHLVVATTRPETLLGDSAVAVHPQDERYQALVGRRVRLPLTDRTIPVIADAYVEREFGTGVVKITPAHDFNDYAVGQRHGLPQINIFNPDATIGEAAPAAYRGLDRVSARKRVLADLEAQGLLERVEDRELMVPHGDRTGAVIEPFLTDQWFVRMRGLADAATQAVHDGRIRFVPENWSTTYFQWLNGIQDWCISRSLWWGHRIPAWYDAEGSIYVGRSEDEVRRKHALGAGVALRQDDGTFDTWFSSALWPFSTLGWPDDTADLRRFYPTQVLVTGFDIIFFWVARMAMMGIELAGDVPFREVYVHGLVRDAEGQKMSKSKGNVLDPLDLVEGISLEDLVAKRTSGLMQPQKARQIEQATRKAYPAGIDAVGVDALRFTFSVLASPGRDIRFDAARAAGYRNFCNKIWNASRFVIINCEGHDTGLDASLAVELGIAERWIVSRLQRVEAEAAAQFKAYRFDLLASALYHFVWDEYCDWYVELVKPVLQGGSPEAQRGARRTLVRVLETWLRLLHPLMPFITEDLWQRVAVLAGVPGETIMHAPYPRPQAEKIDAAAEADILWLQGFALGVRRIRAERDIAPSKVLPVEVRNASASDRDRLLRTADRLRFLARIEAPVVAAEGSPEPQAAVALLGDMKILVPLAGFIDPAAEKARLSKQIDQLEASLGRDRTRLSDEKFASGAPAPVVAKLKERVEQQARDLEVLREQLGRIAALA